MPFVLDNSVVSGWYLRDQADDYSESIAQRLLDDRAVVPVIWELELANVLRSACRRQRLHASSAQEILSRIAELPIDVDRIATPPSELLALSLRFDLSAYDASYLALALRLQLPVATRDDALRAAALASGVGAVSGRQ
ncbi:MAG: type II toxin-antitoxin system VapC family toxin [Burkholderiaceae bacterium]|mgnify:FL=1|nr:type II toxin-antitoxin system VapC family toxin [Burkholderiaceae bacterium]